VSVGFYSTDCTILCQWVFTVQALQACVSGCLQYRLYSPVSLSVYSTGCTILCQWVFTVQAVQACVSKCLQYRLYNPVSVGVYSTGCTSLCQWVFTVQAVQACVSGCLQYRLYNPVSVGVSLALFSRPFWVAIRCMKNRLTGLQITWRFPPRLQCTFMMFLGKKIDNGRDENCLQRCGEKTWMEEFICIDGGLLKPLF
jgi:hypothetical protein